MKRRKNKKLIIVSMILIIMSLWVYTDIKASAENKNITEAKLNIKREEGKINFSLIKEKEYKESVKTAEKIIVVFDLNGSALCLADTPKNNVCFYPDVRYEEKLLQDKLYTYFNGEYREIIRIEDEFFINERGKYQSILKEKVGEIKDNKVIFSRAVYLKGESKLKKEYIENKLIYFLSDSEKLCSETELSFIYPYGEFSEFTKIRDISFENTVKNLNIITEDEIKLKEKVLSLTEGMQRENISLLIFTADEMKSIGEEFKNFKSVNIINILPPEDISGNLKSESKSGNINLYNILGDELENTLLKVLKNINDKSLITFTLNITGKTENTDIIFEDNGNIIVNRREDKVTLIIKSLPFEKEIVEFYIKENAELTFSGNIRNSQNKEIGKIILNYSE